MSKKKSFSGSTMTLKDFHGGFIPSDLHLPSAPCTVGRSLDRSGYDRQSTSWVNSIGRVDYHHQSRPSSSPAIRNFNDTSLFSPSSAYIGRLFDEDERKPLDGGSGLGTTLIGSDERMVQPLSMRVERNADLFSSGKLPIQHVSGTGLQFPRAVKRFYDVRGNYENSQSRSVRDVSRSNSDACTVRSELVGVSEPMQTGCSESIALSKLATASALDKVFSGRWQTRPLVKPPADIDVIHYPEPDKDTHLKTGNSCTTNETIEPYKSTLAMQGDISLSVEDGCLGKHLPGNERVMSSGWIKEKRFVGYSNVGQLSRNDGVSGLLEIKPQVHEIERPKTKLLPISKPSSHQVDTKPHLVSTAKLYGWAPVIQFPSPVASSYTVGVSYENSGSSSIHAVSGSYPNAWAARKEVVAIDEPSQTAWSDPIAVAKLVQASAVDKVSSGRWQTKQMVNLKADVEVIHNPEADNGTDFKNGSSYGSNVLMEYYQPTLVNQAERSMHVKIGVRGVGKQLPGYERTMSPRSLGSKEKNFVGYDNVGQLGRNDGVSGSLEFHPPGHSYAWERPKLKLLPRSKPVENSEPPVTDFKQGYHHQTGFVHVENHNEGYGTEFYARPGSDGTKSASKVAVRPKLNLKPWSQPLQELDVHVKRKSNILYGGARPRELVLKERGIDGVADSHDRIQSSNRGKMDASKIATSHAPGRLIEKSENSLFENNRTGKNNSRKDDMLQRSWRSENWRNARPDKQLQQQQQERHRSSDTWRKCADIPNETFLDVPEIRHGKASSAIELAQAFSRSVSDPRRNQMPFSRLMVSISNHQINGY